MVQRKIISYIEEWINDCLKRNNQIKEGEYFQHGAVDHFSLVEEDDEFQERFEIWGSIITKKDDEWKCLKAIGSYHKGMENEDPVNYINIFEINDNEVNFELEL